MLIMPTIPAIHNLLVLLLFKKKKLCANKLLNAKKTDKLAIT